ncbi:MAG: M3 family metallopeptidase, partial [Xanthomonadales bacterium]|nr:M3 family metallopeptidase [Xanthomonadales bacterium]
MRTKHLPLIAAIGLALAACEDRVEDTDPATTAAAPAASSAADDSADTSPAAAGDNPLLAEWTGPYDGVPAFDRMQLEHIEPAMETAMAAHLAELDEIAAQEAAPTFENTIVAMESSGELWNRVTPYYGIWASNLSTPEFREVQQRLAPKIADYQTKISQNRALFDRIKAVRESDQLAQRTPAERRLVELLYDSFALYGAELEGEAAERYAAINQRLAELNTQFSNNVLADEENYVTYLAEDQLGGLPDSFVKSAAAAAAERGREGEYAVLNTRSSMDPFLTYSTERELREKVWRTYYDRGDNADEYDNNAIIQEILALRQERSELLGFDN